MSVKLPKHPGKPFKVTLEFKPMEGLGGGFRSDWVSGGNGEIKAGIDSGAGLGNPQMTFWIERNGKREYYTANIQDVLMAAVAKVDKK